MLTNRRIGASIALVAAAALLTACGGSDTTTTPTTPAAPITTPADADQLQKPDPAERTPAPGATEIVPAPAPAEGTAQPQVSPIPDTPLASPVPEASAPQETTGPCIDPTSPMVTDALASLGNTAPGGNPWIAGAYSDVTGSCGELLWLMAETPGGTASSPSHVVFFRDGTYLGTATSDSYSYTEVVGAGGPTVSVQYRWLAPEDANCCPSGGPAVIDYTWDGSQVVMGQPLPQEMLDSYGPR
ncbi:LppP/LprE family lipoprotein [Rhodococcus artemisiae]|uniref:LppP/LprE family lipoprotein n=1 Tax=Rhodococcus artemisiae TaxID=714159 RepID=A0ABU7LCS0_9NOCA|nr:LppP/LprE family lipoprotein [Rhodococcus artemisiae]MEE2059355.1 LppP/LprE family lipoprotein [Rhodococcus artemisiae]